MNWRVTDQDLRIIRSKRLPTLVRWLEMLNVGVWPKEFPDPEPRGEGDLRASRCWQIMTEVAAEIGWRHFRALRRKLLGTYSEYHRRRERWMKGGIKP